MHHTSIYHKYKVGEIVYFNQGRLAHAAIIESIVTHQLGNNLTVTYYKLSRPDMEILEPFEEHELFKTREEIPEKWYLS